VPEKVKAQQSENDSGSGLGGRKTILEKRKQRGNSDYVGDAAKTI